MGPSWRVLFLMPVAFLYQKLPRQMDGGAGPQGEGLVIDKCPAGMTAQWLCPVLDSLASALSGNEVEDFLSRNNDCSYSTPRFGGDKGWLKAPVFYTRHPKTNS